MELKYKKVFIIKFKRFDLETFHKVEVVEETKATWLLCFTDENRKNRIGKEAFVKDYEIVEEICL